MSSMNFLYELCIVMPGLPSVFRMAKVVSLTVKLVNSVSSDSVNMFYFAI